MPWRTYQVRLLVQYSLPEGGHKMVETCIRQEELNQNIDLKSVHYVGYHNIIVS
jgi:hypothetical protein